MTDLETAARAAMEALRAFAYEATHLSPMDDDGSHKCRISRSALTGARSSIAALEAALAAPPSPPPEWLMRVAIAAREFCEDWKKGDFSLSTLAALDAQSIVAAFETPIDPSTRDAFAVRRAALLDAAAECHIGPSDEWSDETKSGYIAAADDCQWRIRALAEKEPIDE